ncbi:MAG: ABC transporter substrate-binding protein [Bacillota bacterium]|nr:ABC transporter substrate-binding protein [Bacillota bacterium]MDW7683615.1 ABC transporter substrate-binding protein [Bacillota bacterium]
MSKKTKIICMVLLLIVVSVAAAGCGGEGNNEGNGDAEVGTLVFADAGWESIRFHNFVAGYIIENGFGYETEVIAGTTPVTFTGLRSGSIDVYMELWRDNIEDAYNEAVANDEIEVVSVNFDDNAQGLWVPTYVIEGDPERGIEPMAPGLTSVLDLPDYWELFQDPEDPSKGRIVGSPPGWAVDEILNQKVASYGLDETFNYFRPGSDTALASSIARAIERGEAWVGYYWTPTWIMGRYDMTLLEEPAYSDELWEDGYRCEFPATEVTIAVRDGLSEEAPEVVDFLRNYRTSAELTSQALDYMMENETDEETAAVNFLKENQDLWTDWLPEDVAATVLEALSNE